jgi:hypothetical protein
MNRSITTTVASMVAALLLGTAHAAATPASSQPAAPADSAAPAGAQAADSAQAINAPVLQITSVEVIRSKHGPEMDIVRVRGLASTPGWEEAELVPLTRGVPTDGVLELMFVAKAPAQAGDAEGYEVIEAIFPLEPNHPFKGVNVRGASNSVAVGQLPGYAEAKSSAAEDCSHCVGKLLVAKGASAPVGKSAADVVREEQLPPGSRIIKHTEGIASADSNPNRLTLIVNSEGRIKSAVWE